MVAERRTSHLRSTLSTTTSQSSILSFAPLGTLALGESLNFNVSECIRPKHCFKGSDPINKCGAASNRRSISFRSSYHNKCG